MTVFNDAELAYLREETRGEAPRLARIATVGSNGMPHVTPVGWRLVDADTVIEIGGIDLVRTKKFKDVARSGVAALVIDDVLPPWRPRGIEVRGSAQALDGPEARIRIVPTRIVSWGLRDGAEIGQRDARDVRQDRSR